MRRLLTPFLLALALVALVTGCNSHPPLTGLSVELTKLERAADGSITATLQVINSSVMAFNVASSKHQVFLNGRLAGSLEISEPLGLPAEHNMTQTGRLKLEGGAPAPGAASYQINSALTLLLYGDTKEIQKFTSTGTVQVP